MKRLILLFFLLLLFCPANFAQDGEHIGGGRFLKRIEYKFKNNVIRVSTDGKTDGTPNVSGKSELEQLLFGDFNAQVEFTVSPSFSPIQGFRIVKDSLGSSYMIEFKYISNYREVEDQLDKEFPTIGVPVKLHFELPEDISKLIGDHNRSMWPKHAEARLKRYTVGSLSAPVSDVFVEKLYNNMFSAIDDFKATGRPAGIFDGTTVTFRCVVDDQLWTLMIHEPRGDIREFSDLCQQIVSDLQSGAFEETKYIKLLK